MGTFIKEFGCSDASVVENTVNKYASKNDLEIRQICVVIDEKSKWRYRAVVLFERPIEIHIHEKPTIISGPVVTTSPPKKP